MKARGFKLAMQVLDRGRLHISGVCVGVAQRLIGEPWPTPAEREQFGQKIGEFQLIQAMLADSQTEAYAASTMVLDAARRRDAGQNVTMESACAKYFASEMVGRVADRAVQIFGGAGYVADYGIERFYRERADIPDLRGYEPGATACYCSQSPQRRLSAVIDSIAVILLGFLSWLP